jgi:hypothetical protein
MSRANGRRGASVAALLVVACLVVLVVSAVQWSHARGQRNDADRRSETLAVQEASTSRDVARARQALAAADAGLKTYRQSVARRVRAAQQLVAAADEVLLSQQRLVALDREIVGALIAGDTARFNAATERYNAENKARQARQDEFESVWSASAGADE